MSYITVWLYNLLSLLAESRPLYIILQENTTLIMVTNVYCNFHCLSNTIYIFFNIIESDTKWYTLMTFISQKLITIGFNT